MIVFFFQTSLPHAQPMPIDATRCEGVVSISRIVFFGVNTMRESGGKD